MAHNHQKQYLRYLYRICALQSAVLQLPRNLLTWWVSPVSWHRSFQVPFGVGADQLLHFFNNKLPFRAEAIRDTPGPFSGVFLTSIIGLGRSSELSQDASAGIQLPPLPSAIPWPSPTFQTATTGTEPRLARGYSGDAIPCMQNNNPRF